MEYALHLKLGEEFTLGSNRFRIVAALRDSLTMNGGSTTFHGFYETMAGGAADSASQAADLEQNHSLLLRQLVNQRDSVSGVSLEDEMTHILAAQKSFQAAAQLVTTVDNLLSTVIAMVR